MRGGAKQQHLREHCTARVAHSLCLILHRVETLAHAIFAKLTRMEAGIQEILDRLRVSLTSGENDWHQRRMGHLVDRVHRELTREEIEQIAGVYHAWKKGKGYKDRPGWWKTATIKEIRQRGYVLTPGRYVGAEEQEDDGVPFEEKMAELTA